MTEPTAKYFDDNGTEINPDVIPSLSPAYASLVRKMGWLEKKKSSVI